MPAQKKRERGPGIFVDSQETVRLSKRTQATTMNPIIHRELEGRQRELGRPCGPGEGDDDGFFGGDAEDNSAYLTARKGRGGRSSAYD